MQKLKISQIVSISLMLFAIFFGAGNMIFPPQLGQNAGTNMFTALAGFIFTDAGIAVLGIVAVVLVGTTINDLGNIVGKKFSLCFAALLYLLLGPLFALPRTGTVSFELAVLPFLGEGMNPTVFSIIFTAIFFIVTYFLSSNPSKIVDIVGKVLTPILLIAIVVIWVGTVLNPGAIGAPVGDYATMPFFEGMIEGYLSVDGIAGPIFAIMVIQAIRNTGVTEKKSVVKYTLLCGLVAALLLSVVYYLLVYIGATSSSLGSFSNGGQLLSAVTQQLYGSSGSLILGIAVLFACLTTSIGLTSAFSEYFSEVLPKYSYKQIAAAICIFSFGVANIGLSTLITVTLPVLMMVFPVTVVLIVLSFFKNYIKDKKMVYILGMLFAFIVAFIDAFDDVNIYLGPLTDLAKMIPLFELGIGWVIPAIIGSLIGFLPFLNRKSSKQEVLNA
ncbi:MAG: branched-chain amino acid transport system II carrier protein [Erysipelotrichaceae bacterium]|nr:branched-chain amino acid transport system II carrier protein [Erysipelotrichaceae bacterium]